MSRRPDMLAAALAVAERGWRVFPLCPNRKQPRRAATDWEARATTDAERLARWWRRHPADNVAIATGPSRLVVVDLDRARPGEVSPPEWPGARDGTDVMAALVARHGASLPATYVVATASGGCHRYYRAPKGAALGNTQGRLGWHVDTRGRGGYVVAAGSVVDGRPYAVLDEREPVELPAWLARLLAPPRPPRAIHGPAPATGRPPSRARGYVAAALRGEVQRVLDAPVGGRNAALNRAAWNLGRHVAAGSLPRHVAEDALCAAGEANTDQGAAGVAATVRSALDARLRRTGAG